MHKWTSIVWTSSIYDHFIIWLSSETLSFKLREQMIQMNNCTKLFWNQCINVQVIVWTSSISFDFQVWPWPSTYLNNVSNEQLCQIILKSMHTCTSYGPDKLNLWAFYHLTFKCDLDLQPTWTNVSTGTSTPQGQLLCQVILKSMDRCTSYGPDKL